ncbi:MAG: hypothetical protein IJR63_08955 [Synergistaceae bacterium]|nr:hypothetical protein [Synergistaceae bacterium]
MILIMLAVSGLLFTFADIGGNIALNIAKSHLSRSYGISLSAEKITGNPIKGYTIQNFGLTDTASSIDIFSARFLSVSLNLSALVTGNLRLAEISLGGISMDVDDFAGTVRKLALQSPSKPAEVSLSFMAAPAYAEDDMPNIPIDRLSIVDSRFSSRMLVLDVRKIIADVVKLNVDVDGKVNGLPMKGSINMDGLTDVNRSELYLGTGKIIATGGLNDGRLDLHVSAEDFDVAEMTALYPAMFKAEDFSGKADFTASISGTADKPRISGSVDYLGTKIYGYPIERASANFTYSGGRMSVSNIQASAFNIPIHGEIAAVFLKDEPASLMVKLDGSEAYFNDMDKILGIPELKDLSGRVSSFSVNISGTPDALSGLASFTAPKVAYDGRTLTDLRTQMKLVGSNTANVDGKFTFEDAPGYISGSVSSILKTPQMNLTAKIAGLDIKRIESMIPDAPRYKLDGKITASVTVKGTASSPDVTGEISSPEFSGWGQKIIKPALNFTYSGNTLTLSRTEGTVNGMPLNVAGKISDIPSANPKLDINATITMTPSALKEYVPDIDSYSLKGTINAGVKITGDVNNPSVRLLAQSDNLQAMDMVTAEGLEVTTALDGDLSKMEKISVNIAAESLTASGITLTGANTSVSRNGDSVILGGLRAHSGQGTITGAGTASLSGKSPLDFSFRFSDLALETLAASSSIDIRGKLSGVLRLAGENSAPAVTMSANIPALTVSGITADNVTAEVSGNMNRLSGTVKSPSLSANGLKLSDVNIPMSFSGNNLASKGGTAKIYGGTLNNSLTFSTDTMSFKDDISADSVDVGRLVHDVFPQLEGRISGAGRLAFTVTGSAKSYSGNGNLSVGQGAITGFKWLDIFTRLHKSDGLKFSGVNAPMTLQTGLLTIKAGAAMNAVKDDALYRYVKLSRDGTVNFAGKVATVDFTTESSVNYQMIRAIQGGIKGGIEALFKGGVSGFQDNVAEFLKGGISGAKEEASAGDFRAVTLRVHGRTDNLAFSGLKIGESTLKADTKQQKKPGNVREKVTEILSDSLKPNPQAQTPREKVEERLKEELRKGIQKGLGDLLRR